MPIVVRAACFGDVNVDVVVSVPRLPELGDEAFGTDSRVGVGGSAANTATGLARLGVAPTMIAQVGDDALGRTAVADLTRSGVDTEHVLVSPTATTGLNLISITPDGERTMIGARGANAVYDRTAHPWLDAVSWVHVSAYALLTDPQRRSAVSVLETAARGGVPISVDVPTGVARTLGTDLVPFLADVDVVAMGDDAADHLGWPPSPLGEGAGGDGVELVAITAAGAPVRVVGGSGEWTLTPPALPAVDSTGAGDAFVAGLVAGRLRGLSVVAAVVLASAAGAATARRDGSTMPEPALLAGILDGHTWPEATDDDVGAVRDLLASA